MSKLEIHKPKPLTRLSQQIIKATQSKKLKEIEIVPLSQNVAFFWTQCHKLKGSFEFSEEKKQAIQEVSAIIANDLKTDYPNLTYEEFKLCVLRGLKGRFNDNVPLSYESAFKWLSMYVKNERLQAIKEDKIRIEKENKIERENQAKKNEAENKKKLQQQIIALYDYKKANGTYIGNEDWGNAYYNLLDSAKMITLQKEAKSRILKKAEIEQKKQMAQRVSKKDPIKAKNIIAQNVNQMQNEIKIIAKKIALDEQFEMWILEGKELSFK